MKHTRETKLNAIIMLDGVYVETFKDVDDVYLSKDKSIYLVEIDNVIYTFKKSKGFLVTPYYDVPEFEFKASKSIEDAIDKTMEELYETTNLSEG